MGCKCCSNQDNKLMGENISIKGDKEINYKNNNENKINQNMQIQNQKEEKISKIKNPVKIDSSNDKSNKLKKSDIEEEQKNNEKNKLIEQKTDYIEKIEEKEIVSKNQYNQRVFEIINQIRLNPPEYSKNI